MCGPRRVSRRKSMPSGPRSRPSASHSTTNVAPDPVASPLRRHWIVPRDSVQPCFTQSKPAAVRMARAHPTQYSTLSWRMVLTSASVSGRLRDQNRTAPVRRSTRHDEGTPASSRCAAWDCAAPRIPENAILGDAVHWRTGSLPSVTRRSVSVRTMRSVADAQNGYDIDVGVHVTDVANDRAWRSRTANWMRTASRSSDAISDCRARRRSAQDMRRLRSISMIVCVWAGVTTSTPSSSTSANVSAMSAQCNLPGCMRSDRSSVYDDVDMVVPDTVQW